ncbi:MAG: hypothetical protein RLO81_15510 [Fulvivirga sp.]|uniref:hypothetical protein n=1 Tax=Fulvivirga sp. TaxID=1931237 RepID=UPI0032F07CC0
MSKYYLIIIFCSLLYLPTTSLASDLPKGEFLDSIKLNENSNLIYSLYLPGSYSSEKEWPIIYFFDPGGLGFMPIKNYQSIAEEFGFIIICSYNSRNGPLENNLKVFDGMLDETFKEFSINKERIICSGFSGGSRVSLALANDTQIINTVIACGAGEPSIENLYKFGQFNYVSLVGHLDFNLLEMIELDSKMDNLKINNYRLVFTGPHRWPPLKYYREAVLWTMNNWGMNSILFSETVDHRIDSLITSNNLVEAQRNIDQLKNVSYDNKIIDQKSFKKQKKLYIKAIKYETNLRSEIMESFKVMYQKLYSTFPPNPDSINVNIWEGFSKKTNKLIESDDELKKDVGTRMRSFISANLFERIQWNIQAKDWRLADKFAEMWQFYNYVPQITWQLAKIFASNGEEELAIRNLRILLINSSDYSFQNIIDEDVFNNLLMNESNYDQLKELSKTEIENTGN